MGLFCANIHLETTDVAAVRDSLNSEAVVLDAENGWTAVYTPRLLEGGTDEIDELATALSANLGVRAVSFWVFDSDIARYWLHDSGTLIDRHDSWPDYFEEDSSEIGAGNPNLLATFCREGMQTEGLSGLLTTEAVFAEDVVAGVALAVGISQARALRDYRDALVGTGNEIADFDLGDLAGIGDLFPGSGSPVPASDSAVALVNAAVAGDVAEIRRRVAAGAPLEDEAPALLPGGQSLAGLGMALPREIPAVSMTPLIAAIAHGQVGAVAVVLELGADPNRLHELYGSAVHAAAGSGNPDLLTMVLDAGGSPDIRNRQGHRPIQVLRTSRQQLDLLEQAKTLLDTLGAAMPDLIEQLGPPEELARGWDACEAILRARGETPD